MTATTIRDDFIASLDHIEVVRAKLVGLNGRGKPLTFPDHHKLAEGLLLSAWTHWEEFLRELFIFDLASEPSGALRSEIKKFRTKNACFRLAEAMVGHPDENKWIEWSDFASLLTRADSLLGSGNRFRRVAGRKAVAASPGVAAVAAIPATVNQDDLTTIKRIRNAVAHKSDYAWASFRKLAKAAPFSLSSSQMKGITVGRFLTAHDWAGQRVLANTIAILKANANQLVP